MTERCDLRAPCGIPYASVPKASVGVVWFFHVSQKGGRERQRRRDVPGRAHTAARVGERGVHVSSAAACRVYDSGAGSARVCVLVRSWALGSEVEWLSLGVTQAVGRRCVARVRGHGCGSVDWGRFRGRGVPREEAAKAEHGRRVRYVSRDAGFPARTTLRGTPTFESEMINRHRAAC